MISMDIIVLQLSKQILLYCYPAFILGCLHMLVINEIFA